MSDDRLAHAAATASRLRNQRCTTEGHDDRPGQWLIPADPPGRGKRWVCTACKYERQQRQQ